MFYQRIKMDTMGSIMAKPEQFFQPNSELVDALSKFVKLYRVKHNLTQKELAERCGFHDKFIQTIETQKRNISISAFVQLAEGFKMNPGKLLNMLLIKA